VTPTKQVEAAFQDAHVTGLRRNLYGYPLHQEPVRGSGWVLVICVLGAVASLFLGYAL
jgi:hypothetical protein